MAVDLRLPNITADTQSGQMAQMQSYMYQLVQQLNWALSTIDSASSGNSSNVVLKSSTTQPLSQEQALETFNSIKALIIKSADIVESYYDKMKLNFDGIYVASSEFGQFAEKTNQTLEADATKIQQNFTNLQVMAGQINTILESQAWIKSGLLDYDSQGAAIYGVEVGQKNIVDGVEVFNKYARFTAGGIYFYLPGTTEAVAWMTGNKLYITNAEITGSLKLGKYSIDTSNGLSIKWVGR